MKNFELIYEKYGFVIDEVYNQYFYVELDYELYKKFVVRTYEKAEKSNNEIDMWFKEYLVAAMQNYVKRIFEDHIKAFNVVCNYIESKIKNISSYSQALNAFKKICLFLSSVYDNYKLSHFQKFLDNPTLYKILQIIVNKNLSIINNGKLHTIFSDHITSSFIEAYCLKNNIEFETLDDLVITEEHSLTELELQNIKRFEKPLPDEEIRGLILRALNGDKRAEEKIIVHNYRLVASVVCQYLPYCQSLQFMDLFQEGNIGLLKAIKKFDFDKGCKFSTYATWWIRHDITRAITNTDRMIRISVGLESKLYNYRKCVRELEDRLGRKATFAEIAQAMNISIQKVIEFEKTPDASSSLNTTVVEDGDIELIDTIIDEETSYKLDKMLDKYIVEEFIQSLDRIGKISDKNKQILIGYYGLRGRTLSLMELGKIYGISRQAVSAAKERAMRRFLLSSIAENFIVYADKPDMALQLLDSYRVSK